MHFSTLPILRVLVPMAFAWAQTVTAQNQEVGNRACAGCHAEIYRKYSATGMARSSGRIGRIDNGSFRESFEQATFSDPGSGADYRVTAASEGHRLEFSKSSSGVQGQRLLEWFLGSGSLGRSYVFSLDGFLFQSPVSYYSAAAKWDVSPGYERKQTVDLTRTVETACLQCHASRLQPIAGTQNRFGTIPFLQGGVSCERCHGPGKNHVARMTARSKTEPGEIVNPAKLDPARRDSVCAQCHLTGAARVATARSKSQSYRPGDLLSLYLAVFVWSNAGSSELTATSHYEKLRQSACKKASGNRLWCGSCHDPHDQPSAASRVEYFRNRCLACHESLACKGPQEARRKVENNCVGCHMPNRQTRAVEHVAFTDHSIPRRQVSSSAPIANRSLVSFWNTEADPRDLALAYAVVAPTEPGVRPHALALLQKAETGAPEDVAVLAQLAQFHDKMGQEDKALALYQRILRIDPAHVAAATNLGIYYMKRGRPQGAISLWRNVLARNPGFTSARMNLAVALYRSGEMGAAESTIFKALEYDPDLDLARKLLAEIQAIRR